MAAGAVLLGGSNAGPVSLPTALKAVTKVPYSGVRHLGEVRDKHGAAREIGALERTRALVLGRSWLGFLSRPIRALVLGRPLLGILRRPTRFLGGRLVCVCVRLPDASRRLFRPRGSGPRVEVRGKLEEAALDFLIGRGAAKLYYYLCVVYSQRKPRLMLKVGESMDIWLYKEGKGRRCDTKSGARRARSAQCNYPPLNRARDGLRP